MNKKQIKKAVIAILILIVAGVLLWIYACDNHKDSSKEANSVKSGEQKKSSSENTGVASWSSIETDKPIDYDGIFKEGKPFILALGSENCEYCQELKPILQKLSKKYQDKLCIKYVDIKKHPDYCDDYEFNYIPSLIFFKGNGKPYIPSKKYIDKYDFEIVKDDSSEAKYTINQGKLSFKTLDKIVKSLI